MNNDEERGEDATSSVNQEVKWYMIRQDGDFRKLWEFVISLLILYTAYLGPFVLVEPNVY